MHVKMENMQYRYTYLDYIAYIEVHVHETYHAPKTLFIILFITFMLYNFNCS